MKSYEVRKVKKSFFGKRKMNLDAFWVSAQVLTDFEYPWENEEAPAIIFRAVHDTKRLYFRFDVIDTNICVISGSEDKMDVMDSDRVEIFFRQDAEMKQYYGLEMDPHGRNMDYKAEFYRKFDYTWKMPRITVRAEYSLNGYKVWGCIEQNTLKELNLLQENKIEAGLFRGKCIRNENSENNFKWISWVKPESDKPDFHIPSAFGCLELR